MSAASKPSLLEALHIITNQHNLWSNVPARILVARCLSPIPVRGDQHISRRCLIVHTHIVDTCRMVLCATSKDSEQSSTAPVSVSISNCSGLQSHTQWVYPIGKFPREKQRGKMTHLQDSWDVVHLKHCRKRYRGIVR